MPTPSTTCSRGHPYKKTKTLPVCPKCWPGFYKKKDVLLLTREEASAFVEILLNQGARILGFDGFTLQNNGKKKPSLEDIADYSSKPATPQDMNDFLKNMSPTVTHVEILLKT